MATNATSGVNKSLSQSGRKPMKNLSREYGDMAARGQSLAVGRGIVHGVEIEGVKQKSESIPYMSEGGV
jgi:hypothetical protein